MDPARKMAKQEKWLPRKKKTLTISDKKKEIVNEKRTLRNSDKQNKLCHRTPPAGSSRNLKILSLKNIEIFEIFRPFVQ